MVSQKIRKFRIFCTDPFTTLLSIPKFRISYTKPLTISKTIQTVWNDFYETLDGFADHLKLWYYFCGTFPHFPVSVKVSKNVHQTPVPFVHQPKVLYHFYGTFCTFYSPFRFRKQLVKPVSVSYTIPRLHSFVHITIHEFIVYDKVSYRLSRSLSSNPLSVFLWDVPWLTKSTDRGSQIDKVDFLL